MKPRLCLLCGGKEAIDVHRGKGMMRIDGKPAAFVNGEPYFLHAYDPGERRQSERRAPA